MPASDPFISQTPYTVYSGIAAEDLMAGSQTLAIICPELLPGSAYGTVAAGVTTGTIKLQDRDGNAISQTINTANHIVATWEGDTNKPEPPFIRKGEPVDVLKRANQDKFTWRENGRGRSYRTTETHRTEVAATNPNNPGQVKDDTNTYSTYVDSVNQVIGFKSSKANGEACGMSAHFDLKKGTWYVTDDAKEPGNRVFMDTGSVSGTPVFQVNLETGLALKLEGDHAFLKIPKSFQIDCGERFIINSPLMVFNLNKTGYFFINAASVAINTASDFVVSAGTVIGLNALSTKISGVLVAGGARIANAIKGAFGSTYSPSTISNPTKDSAVASTNSADTSTSGTPYQA